MKVLFIHQNFPGQYKHLAPALAAHKANEVVAFSMQAKSPGEWQGVCVVPYNAARSTTPNVHPWVADFETKTIRAEAAFRAALKLRAEGFMPDIVIAHPGWGESLFIKDVWPDTKLGIYCEFFYNSTGGDVGFDPEFPITDPGDVCRLRLKNLNNFLHFQTADAGISPTQWQASTFPEDFRKKITVVHDGIDTEMIKPSVDVKFTLNDPKGSIELNKGDEIITFVNRNLEPYRGYHIFMRALPELLKARPNARVLIVGADDVSYGARAPKGQKWRDIFLAENAAKIGAENMQRLHFLGHVSYQQFIPLLQISMVHVYLTYPFVLSWSLLEAMSVGCAIVASDTQPLQEAIKHNKTGRLVNFFDARALVKEVCDLLDKPKERAKLGKNARAFAQANYDLKTVCLPRQLEWVQKLADT